MSKIVKSKKIEVIEEFEDSDNEIENNSYSFAAQYY